jgi:hypothetical protein
VGDPLLLRKAQEPGDQNKWHVHAVDRRGELYRVGKMEAAYSPGSDRDHVPGRVFALVRWKREDSAEYHQSKIQYAQWFTVVPEWAIEG